MVASHPILQTRQRQTPSQYLPGQAFHISSAINPLFRSGELHPFRITLDLRYRLPQRRKQQNFITGIGVMPAHPAGETLLAVPDRNPACELEIRGCSSLNRGGLDYDCADSNGLIGERGTADQQKKQATKQPVRRRQINRIRGNYFHG